MAKNFMHEEKEYVRKVKAGDKKAFKALYDSHVDSLYLFMKQFSYDTSQVEDWVQRAFIKAYLNILKFDGISLFKTWLFKIALNEMRMDYRKAGLAKKISFEEEDVLTEIEDVNLQWNQVMKDWLFELPEIKRMVFLLFEVEGYSHSEIAELLNLKESTSRTILTRTKVWLKQKWMSAEGTKC
jgi:RNA polymerase sigma factor, sigma-70 family